MFTLDNGVELRTGDVVKVSFSGCDPIYSMYFDMYGGETKLIVRCTGDDATWTKAINLNSMQNKLLGVYRPTNTYSWPFVNGVFQKSLYRVIYDNYVKELTVDEISRLLGYKVKVVGEDQKGCS